MVCHRNRRVAAQVVALFNYGICRSFYWYGFLQESLVWFFFLSLSHKLFCIFVCSESRNEDGGIRIDDFNDNLFGCFAVQWNAVAVLMSVGAFIYLCAWIALASSARNLFYCLLLFFLGFFGWYGFGFFLFKRHLSATSCPTWTGPCCLTCLDEDSGGMLASQVGCNYTYNYTCSVVLNEISVWRLWGFVFHRVTKCNFCFVLCFGVLC